MLDDDDPGIDDDDDDDNDDYLDNDNDDYLDDDDLDDGDGDDDGDVNVTMMTFLMNFIRIQSCPNLDTLLISLLLLKISG